MKCKILHESKQRMRIHFHRSFFSLEEADRAEYYLKGLSFITDAKVSERTADAAIYYKAGKRDEVIRALSLFDPEDSSIDVPGQTGRATNHAYEDRLCLHILQRIFTRLILPAPLRAILALGRSIPYLSEGARCLSHGRLEVPTLDATSILVSLIRRDFNTAGSIMFLLGVGDIMDEWTKKKSVNDLARAMALNVDKVWQITPDGEEILTDIRKIKVEDKIIVRTGGLIPLDGTVFGGDASVNQASITGEGLPVHKYAGSYVYAGTVVEEGELRIIVKKSSGNGQYDRIARMIEESEKLKSAAEEKAFRMADKLVPYTFGATAATWLLTRNVNRAVSILMVDFCCALKLSTPIAVLSAMREAGQHHISVKGGKFLEAVANADTIIFDKTGTLTHACPRVHDVIPFDGADPDEALRLAACLEEHYPHSMANAVVKAAADKGLIHEEKHSRVEYVVAHGIASTIDGQKAVIGSYHFVFEDEGCIIDWSEQEKFRELSSAYSHLYLAVGGRVKAAILVEDPVKKEAGDVIRRLNTMGLRTVMLTGDSSRVAGKVAAELGMSEYLAQVLPEDKAEFIRREHTAGHTCIMIGDGVNDSPALSEADAGVAIVSGAAIAREVADIMISEDDLYSLVTLRELSHLLRLRTGRNYRGIVGFNGFLMLMGALGIFSPTTTALLHNGSTIAISLRSMTNLLKR